VIFLQLILFANTAAFFCSLLRLVSHVFWGDISEQISTPITSRESWLVSINNFARSSLKSLNDRYFDFHSLCDWTSLSCLSRASKTYVGTGPGFKMKSTISDSHHRLQFSVMFRFTRISFFVYQSDLSMWFFEACHLVPTKGCFFVYVNMCFVKSRILLVFAIFFNLY